MVIRKQYLRPVAWFCQKKEPKRESLGNATFREFRDSTGKGKPGKTEKKQSLRWKEYQENALSQYAQITV